MSSSKTAPDTFLRHLIHENGVRRILARVTPNQPRFFVANCILQDVDGAPTAVLKVQLSAPPEEGKANKELTEGLKALLGCELALHSGHQSRSKLLLVTLYV